MKKRLGILVVAAILLSGMLSGCSNGNAEIEIDLNTVGRNEVFSINGSACTKEEARLYLYNYQNLLGYEYGIDLWQHDYGDIAEEDTLEAYVKDVTLAELANVMCMNQLAETREITLTQDEENKVFEAADEYYESLTKEERRAIGLDKSELKDIYEKYAIAQKLYATLTQGVNEEVSDDEARVVLIQQIYVRDKETANRVRQKLNKGEDFASVASNYNEASAIEIHLARGTYSEKVDKVVFHMENNEQSGMIETEEGFYFFKCLNKYVVDMTEANKENIIVQRRKEQFDDVFRQFVEESDFDLNERVWENIKVDFSGEIKTDSFFEIYVKHFK